MAEFDELISIFEVELKRGSLTLAILSQMQNPQYGYSLLQNLTKKGVEIEAGTLYPMLRRLEKQEILTSDWDTTESRPRKYYILSQTGMKVYIKLKEIWERQVSQMNKIIGETDYGND